MIYLTREDDISVLPLSNRLMNCLRRIGIHTVGSVLDYPEEEWHNVRNMGTKSVEEVMGWVRIIRNGELDYYLIEDGVIIDNKELIKEVSDISVEELGLSVRAVNCLNKSGITMVSQLIGISYEELMAIQNMGKKTADEIFKKAKEYEEKFLVEAEQGNSVLDEYEMFIAKEAGTAFGIESRTVIREILAVKELYPEALGETFVYLLYEREAIKNCVSGTLLKWIEKSNDEISRKALFARCPEHVRNTTVIEEILVDLENKCAIEIGEIMIYRQYPSISWYINTFKNERDKEVLRFRLKGKTLEEIGNKYGITRERIRQITAKALRDKPRLREDLYTYIFDKYDFSRKGFCNAFGEPIETYQYLEIICVAGHEEKRPVEELLEDENVSIRLKKLAEKAIYADYVTIEGIRVKRKRIDLVNFVIKKYCRNKTSFDDFLEYYNILLSTLGLEENESLKINERSYENKLNDSDIVLWNQWRSLRYYNISERDYTELYDTLDLSQHENVELSALKFFRDYPELMKEYDIRDEYELHNLMKKTLPSKYSDVNFKRMPTIEIGEADREEQIMDILIQYSPITAEDFGKEYESRFGVKSSTVLGSYMKNFDKYFFNGIYSVDADELAEEQYRRMKEILVNDIYMISDVNRIYCREFPGENQHNINPYTLKTLGFRVYSGYIIKNNFASATEYFNYILTKDDIVDMRELLPSVKNIVAYTSELYYLKAKREIVEFATGQYVNIRRLNMLGVTVSDIEDYCNKVTKFVDEGCFFTVYSLRKLGFSHPLDDLGFDDWFYSSLLAEDKDNYTFRRAGGSKIFYRGEKEIQVADLIISIVEKLQKIEVHDLYNMLEQDYNLRFPYYKTLEIVYDTDLYYDSIMETVYIDYDTYFEEI